jgi:hypothetical protein
MKSSFHKSVSCFCLPLSLLIVACYQVVPAPPPPPPSSEAIAKVTAAKKIFVSNLGEARDFANDIPGGVNVTYNEFCAALKQWGYFQLVDSPAQADLVFEIQGTEQIPDVEHRGIGSQNKDYSVTRHPPLLNLTILDTQQHVLYQIVLPAGRAGNIPKGKIAFAQSIDALTDQVKALVASPAPPQNP